MSPWTDDEIAAAKAECTATLSGVRLDFEPLSPIQHGLCGTPAPILLRSLGVDQKVELDPPATISCDLAKALSEWVDAVQREAKEQFGAAIAKLRAMSACEMRKIVNQLFEKINRDHFPSACSLSTLKNASAAGEKFAPRRCAAGSRARGSGRG